MAAKTLVSKGARVFGFNRQSAKATDTLVELQAACQGTGKFTHINCDLQDFQSIRAAAAELEGKLAGDPLYALVNNAGMLPSSANIFGSAPQALGNLPKKLITITHRCTSSKCLLVIAPLNLQLFTLCASFLLGDAGVDSPHQVNMLLAITTRPPRCREDCASVNGIC